MHFSLLMAKEYFCFSSNNNSTTDNFLSEKRCGENTVKSFLYSVSISTVAVPKSPRKEQASPGYKCGKPRVTAPGASGHTRCHRLRASLRSCYSYFDVHLFSCFFRKRKWCRKRNESSAVSMST